jgi:4-hydroxybenzoate polyprenyltransferase
LLDGLATGALAVVAGAAAPDAVRLGIAMTALQAGIGAVNDLRDAPTDAAGKPAKPIPSGLVTRRLAAAVAVVAIGVGIGLSIPSGWETVAIALAGLGVGLAYDLGLKGTAWSWLPFAAGVPLLPVYAWYGGTGSLPAAFAILVPAAMAAGAALAIGNARADAERDAESGVESIATALGPRRAWATQVAILAAVGVVAVASAAAAGATIGELGLIGAAALVPVIPAVVSRDVAPGTRELAWEVQAVGIAALGVAWLWVALA